jgi:hypothetical protein
MGQVPAMSDVLSFIRLPVRIWSPHGPAPSLPNALASSGIDLFPLNHVGQPKHCVREEQ